MAVIRTPSDEIWGSQRWQLMAVLRFVEPYLMGAALHSDIIIAQKDRLNYLDLFGKAEGDLELFERAVSDMVKLYREEGATLMPDPEGYVGFMSRLEELLIMLKKP